MRAAACIVMALALGGCASLGKEKAPVCDGKHRRPANLYGSVLDPATPPAAQAPDATRPAAKPAYPDKLSALSATYGSCA